jgi:hypothetical protein
MLQEDDRIIIEDARQQQAFRVGRGGGHDDLQAWYVGEPRLQVLRVRWPLPPAAADDHPHRHWHATRATEHEAPLSCIVDDLVEREQREIEPLMRHHRPESTQRRAHGDSGHGVFRGRHIEHAVGAEFVAQPCRGAEHAQWVGDPETVTDDAAVLGQGDPQRVADRRGEGHGRHGGIGFAAGCRRGAN